MLDLAQDLPLRTTTDGIDREDDLQLQQNSKHRKKRKREVHEAEQLRKQESGAGGLIPLSESYVGDGRHVRKLTNSVREETRLSLLEEVPRLSSDEDEEFALRESALAQLRRNGEQGGDDQPMVNGRVKHEVNGLFGSGAPQPHPVQVDKARGPVSFLSLKYRQILGVVRIGNAGDEHTNPGEEEANPRYVMNSGIEVAIIERPLWDVEFPPRFDGGQDWET